MTGVVMDVLDARRPLSQSATGVSMLPLASRHMSLVVVVPLVHGSSSSHVCRSWFLAAPEGIPSSLVDQMTGHLASSRCPREHSAWIGLLHLRGPRAPNRIIH